jgi:hypothetical protein
MVVGLLSVLLTTGCARAKELLTEDNGSGRTAPRARTEQHSAPDPSRCVQEYFVRADHICARLKDGSYRCRGSNEFKQATHGNWPGLPAPTPSLQAFPGPWQDLVPGSRRSCGLRDGRLWCWGENAREQIRRYDAGAVRPTIIAEPTLVEGVPPEVIDVDMQGIHLCALHEGGEATCKLGTADLISYRGLPAGAEEISAGPWGICVRTRQDVWCHGKESWAIEGADPTEPAAPRSQGSPGLFKIAGIPGPLKSLSLHCVLNEAGQVWCWGSNYFGELGDGSESRSSCDGGCPGLRPKTGHHAKLPPARQMSSNGAQVCAVTNVGEVWCWGRQQAIGAAEPSEAQGVPIKIEALGNDNLHVHTAQQVCVEKRDHRLFCWGDNDHHQISDQHCGPTRAACALTEVKFSCAR